MSTIATIGEHGVVGDGRSVALIASDATVDWLCWPRFDSDACLAALVGNGKAGAWVLRPLGQWSSAQAYLQDSNVLVTTFRRDHARVTVTDWMPVCSEAEAREELLPEHSLLRRVECQEGEAELLLSLELAPRFGTGRTRLSHRGPNVVCVETSMGTYFVRGEYPLELKDNHISLLRKIRAGERMTFSLIWAPEGPAVLPPLDEGATRDLARTLSFWRAWIGQAQYDGPYRAEVRRSALVLKLLQYPPSGALLAAATTSLPERPGGTLNWDYRYCWLRDAAFTVRALYGLGLQAEADAFVYWLLHTTQLTQPRLAVLYDVYGNPARRERVLGHLQGYQGARPVRVGNGAAHQLQLDVHGEVIDAVCAYVAHGGTLDSESQRMLVGFGNFVSENWHLPDASIWEERETPRHHTHSKALCWVALDRLLRLHQDGRLPKIDALRLFAVREQIATTLRSQGRRSNDGAYVSVLTGDAPDAALLLLPWYGFESPLSGSTRATLAWVRRALDAGGGLLYRTPELREAGDGAFVACGFWAAELVAAGAGTLDEAEQWFRRLLRAANPLGLYAEEIDPRTGEALGNFPQAYSHVALISAALALEERRRATPALSRRRVGSLRPVEREVRT